MKTWLIGGAIGLSLAALAVGTGQGVTESEEKGPAWLNDYAKARELARRTGKPLFVVFRCER